MAKYAVRLPKAKAKASTKDAQAKDQAASPTAAQVAEKNVRKYTNIAELVPERRAEAEERLRKGLPLKASHIQVNLDKSPQPTAGIKLQAKLISDRKVPLSVMKAQEHMELETFEGERRVTPKHMQEIWDMYARGLFSWDIVQMATCKIKDVKYAINGQHSAKLRAELGSRLGTDPTVRYMEWEAPNTEELTKLYSIYDAGKPRSSGHQLKVQLAGGEGMEEIWSSVVTKLGPAMRLWRYEDRNAALRQSATTTAHLIRGEFKELFVTVALYWQKVYSDAPHVKRAGSLAAMLATFNVVPTVAPQFWDPVCTGENMGDRTDPRWVLRETLLRTSQSIVSATSRTRLMDAESMYRVCIQAWNMWRDKRSLEGGTRNLRPAQDRPQPH